MKRLLLFASCLALTGCAGPEVIYQIAPKSDETGLTKFQFADSMVQFAYVTNGTQVDNEHITVTSTPTPSTEVTYAVEGVPWYKNWFTQTDINAVHSTNSQLLSQIGNTVTDEFPTVVGDIAGAAGAAMTFLGAGAPRPPAPPSPTSTQAQPPIGIDFSTFLPQAISLGCQAPSGVNGPISCTGLKLVGGGIPVIDAATKAVTGINPYTANIDVGAIPDDAISLDHLSKPYHSGSYLYSACRNFKITVAAPDGTIAAQASVLVSDPSSLETLAIPPNGKVTANGSCGADSVAGSYTPPDFFKDLGTALTSANSVKTQLASLGSSGVAKK